MLTGGIPKIVNEKSKNGIIASELYADYLDGLKGGWGLQRNEALLKQFAAAIINSAGYTTSWDSLRLQAQLGSWSTSQEYASSLKELAIISIIHRYNTKKKTAMTAKEKKIYFHDPFYMHIFHSWINPSEPFEVSEEFMADSINQGRVAEGVVADHLIRLAFDLTKNKQVFDYTNHVFYWKDHNNREIDFIFADSEKQVPIEVKYRNKIDSRELGGLVNFLDETDTKSGIVLSKNESSERKDYVTIPTAVFLMMI